MRPCRSSSSSRSRSFNSSRRSRSDAQRRVIVDALPCRCSTDRPGRLKARVSVVGNVAVFDDPCPPTPSSQLDIGFAATVAEFGATLSSSPTPFITPKRQHVKHIRNMKYKHTTHPKCRPTHKIYSNHRNFIVHAFTTAACQINFFIARLKL